MLTISASNAVLRSYMSDGLARGRHRWGGSPNSWSTDGRQRPILAHPDSRPPHQGRGNPYADSWEWTEELWQRLEWNKFWQVTLTPSNERQTQQLVDPEATPKPSWDTAYRLGRQAMIDGLPYDRFAGNLKAIEASHSNSSIGHPYAQSAINVGGGMDSMSSLIYHSNVSKVAGKRWPLAVMRDVNNRAVHLWTPDEGDEFLRAVAHNRNRAKSASNLLRNQAEILITLIKDPVGGLAAGASADEIYVARDRALTQYLSLRANLTSRFDAALTEVDASAKTVPDDPARAREVLLARLESEALDRVKFVKGAVSQQGIDLPASCLEEDSALTSIAGLKQSGLTALSNAQTVEAMRQIFDRQVGAIEAVQVLNAPIWTDVNDQPPALNGDGELIFNFVFDSARAGENQEIGRVRVKNPEPISTVENPRTKADLGPVAFTKILSTSFVKSISASVDTVSAPDHNTVRELILSTKKNTNLVADTLLDYTSRNACGPSAELKVRVRATTL